MIAGDKDFEVELHFKHPFSQTVSDTTWHPTQNIDWHDDDSCTLTCTVSGLEEIVWWVLSMGPNCEVIKPEELRTRVQSLAEQTLSAYQQTQTT